MLKQRLVLSPTRTCKTAITVNSNLPRGIGKGIYGGCGHSNIVAEGINELVAHGGGSKSPTPKAGRGRESLTHCKRNDGGKQNLIKGGSAGELIQA
jgi:hypothetical protein